MPNKTHHSVNKIDPAENISVRTGVLALGGLVAALGAAVALLMGGPLAIYVVGGAFAQLLIVFFLLLFITGKLVRAQISPDDRAKLTALERLQSNGVLVVTMTRLGRVRAVFGDRSIVPWLRPGHVADHLHNWIERNADTHFSRRLESDEGDTLILFPKRDEEVDAIEALQERTAFFAGLGHDLKSPLNAVIGFAELMENEVKGPMPKAYRDYPGLISESGRTLLRLVEDILDYARSEAGTYELDLSAVDISSSGESVMRQSEAMAKAAGVTLRMDAGREILAQADASAVRRIWDNLVSNAIKYSSAGDTVTLSTDSYKRFALIRVTDTGEGMDQRDLDRIARPFAQGDNARGRPGTGLGLATVQKLAQLHGGQVRIETAPGEGTAVTVSLPLLVPARQRAAE